VYFFWQGDSQRSRPLLSSAVDTYGSVPDEGDVISPALKPSVIQRAIITCLKREGYSCFTFAVCIPATIATMLLLARLFYWFGLGLPTGCLTDLNVTDALQNSTCVLPANASRLCERSCFIPGTQLPSLMPFFVDFTVTYEVFGCCLLVALLFRKRLLEAASVTDTADETGPAITEAQP
jgi:hypothetical protein